MAFQLEMVVDRSMNGGEFLQSFDVPKSCHRRFPPPKRLM